MESVQKLAQRVYLEEGGGSFIRLPLWLSGSLHACHAGDPGSIPGQHKLFYLKNLCGGYDKGHDKGCDKAMVLKVRRDEANIQVCILVKF